MSGNPEPSYVVALRFKKGDKVIALDELLRQGMPVPANSKGVVTDTSRKGLSFAKWLDLSGSGWLEVKFEDGITGRWDPRLFKPAPEPEKKLPVQSVPVDF